MILWCLLLEEYEPIIEYIEDTDNYAEDELIRIPLIKYDITERDTKIETLSDSYCVNKLGGNTFPLTHQKINDHHRNEK